MIWEYKIETPTEEASREVQDWLFKKGYKWSASLPVGVYHFTKKAAICACEIKGEKELAWSRDFDKTKSDVKHILTYKEFKVFDTPLYKVLND
jgi:hypothetical protein